MIIFCIFAVRASAEGTDRYLFETVGTVTVPEKFSETLTFSETEIKGQNIRNFDVSPSGMILLCLNNCYVNIYNSNGSFLYAIKYNLEGTANAFWRGDYIAIYLNRSNIIVVLDDTGIKEAYKADLQSMENNRLYNKLRTNDTIILGDTTYRLSCSSSLQTAPSQCEIVKDNVSYVIYSNSSASSGAVFTVIFILLVVGVTIFISNQKSEEYYDEKRRHG